MQSRLKIPIAKMIKEIKEFFKSDAGCLLFVILGGYLGLALGFIYLGPPTIEQPAPACQCECLTKTTK